MKSLSILTFGFNMAFVIIMLLVNAIFVKNFEIFSLNSILLFIIGAVLSLIQTIILKNVREEEKISEAKKEPTTLREKLLSFLDELEKMRVDSETLQSAYINSLKLFQSIITDPNTHTIIEKHFIKLVDDEIARASRYNLNFGLLILKISNIENIEKEISSTEIIKNIATLSKKVIRSVDKIGSYKNGLMYLLPQTKLKGAIRAGERILESIKKMNLRNKKGEVIDIKVSIGVSEYPTNGKNYESLIKTAEKNIAQAELLGGNQVIFSA